MYFTREQIISGMNRYAENEVLNKLTTTGKWFLGTGLAMAMRNTDHIMDAVGDNMVVKAIGIVNDDGMYDVDSVCENMRQMADRYGKMVVDLPIIGTMMFDSTDIHTLCQYIHGER